MQIGRKVRVEDVRTVWRRENDFSDWLVSEDGLKFLKDELDIDLENVRREERGSNFPCDIVGDFAGEEHHVVVIENQFGRTDHDHLGKLLTHSAVHRAMTGIWIAEKISDDHRKVIDWLNETTPDTVNLYLARLLLHRIGDSPVAPELDIVCRPNDKEKVRRSVGSSAEGTDVKAWQLEFWQEIQEALATSGAPFRPQKPRGQYWMYVSLGRAGFQISLLITPGRGTIGLEVYLTGDRKAAAFEALVAHRAEIESEFGSAMDWQPLEGKKSARVLFEERIDARDDANRERVIQWFVENTPLFHEVFRKRVAALELD